MEEEECGVETNVGCDDEADGTGRDFGRMKGRLVLAFGSCCLDVIRAVSKV